VLGWNDGQTFLMNELPKGIPACTLDLSKTSYKKTALHRGLPVSMKVTVVGLPCRGFGDLLTPTACPVDDAALCDFAVVIDRLLREGRYKDFLDHVAFESQACMATNDPLLQIAPWAAAQWGCRDAIASLNEGCPWSPSGAGLPESCYIRTHSVHMCSCGQTNSNFRYLTSDQYIKYILPNARVYALLPRGPQGGPYILVSADSRDLSGDYGWSDVPKTWALAVDTVNLMITSTRAYLTGPGYHFARDNSVPWPASATTSLPTTQGRSPPSSSSGGAPAANISASGTGSVIAAPDVVVLVFGVGSEQTMLADAREAAAKAMQAVINSLKSHGVSEKDIRTEPLSSITEPDRSSDGRSILRGYRGYVTARLRQIDSAAKVIDDALKAGGDDAWLQSSTFEIDDIEEAGAPAREQAMREAKKRAEDLARQRGFDLGDPVSISTAASYTSAWWATTIVPLEVTVTVEVTYAIK